MFSYGCYSALLLFLNATETERLFFTCELKVQKCIYNRHETNPEKISSPSKSINIQKLLEIINKRNTHYLSICMINMKEGLIYLLDFVHKTIF